MSEAPQEPFQIVLSGAVKSRMASGKIPRPVVDAVLVFIEKTLAEKPTIVGKPLNPPLDDRWSARRGDFRILYEIDSKRRTVTVVAVEHRSDAYRPR